MKSFFYALALRLGIVRTPAIMVVPVVVEQPTISYLSFAEVVELNIMRDAIKRNYRD